MTTHTIAVQSQNSMGFEAAGFLFLTRNNIDTPLTVTLGGCTSPCTTSNTATPSATIPLVQGTTSTDQLKITSANSFAPAKRFLVRGEIAMSSDSASTAVGKLAVKSAFPSSPWVTLVDGTNTKINA